MGVAHRYPPELRQAPVGTKVWFEGEKQGYTVRARSRRFIVCTKPFNLKKTMIYCVIDLDEGVRGTENLVFGFGAETDEQCEDMVRRLTGEDGSLGYRTEVSHRNRVPIHVTKVSTP